MSAAAGGRWLRPAALAALTYLVGGVAFGGLAGAAPSPQARVTWRLAAWLLSAAAYAAQIAYERYRLGAAAVRTAFHAALAVACGAFGLAVAANVHSYHVASAPRGLLHLALVAWPVLAGVPAFLVAWATAAALPLTRFRGQAGPARPGR